MSKDRVKDIPSGFGTAKPLREQVDGIVRGPSLGYDQKLEKLTRLVSKNEAVLLIGSDPKNAIPLRDTIKGCGKRLFLVIEKRYFDEILAGTKKEEFRELRQTTLSRYSYVDKCDGKRYLRPFDTIHFAVGYHREREEADVEVTDIKADSDMVTFSLGKVLAYYPKKGGEA